MASLIENLIEQLNEEYAVYEKLLAVTMEKTSSIVSNDLERLKTTTDKEQLLVDTITGLDKRRNETMKEIATVLNMKWATMKIIDIVNFLEGQPQFHDPLLEINEKLAKLARKLQEVNAHNQMLIQESLSMIEYSINLMQNLNRAPETAEYKKDMFNGAGSYTGGTTMNSAQRFDSKN